MNSARQNIVVLTGAGISAESGLGTFRGAGGVWEKHRVEDVATPEAYRNNPGLVQRFYNERRKKLQSPLIEPNAAHVALARLEREWPGEFLLVTQNIDDLHERAGSRNVLHMHGKLLEVRCARSHEVFAWKEDVTAETACPCCERHGTLRPNVVWFGELPLEMVRIYAALEPCDLFLSVGTSGNVYPAAGFAEAAKNNGGAHTVELNLEPSAVNLSFVEREYGPASRIVPAYVERLLEGGPRQSSNC
jgi:NAD-dependent deacetylase